jgi:hypothetical protein
MEGQIELSEIPFLFKCKARQLLPTDIQNPANSSPV